MTTGNGERESVWERRITVILVGLLFGIGGWTALAVQGQTERTARIEERVAALSTQIQDMKSAMQDRYTKGDAARDLAVRDRQIADMMARIQRLERRGEK